MKKSKIIYAILLFGCLLNFSYDYYMVVRTLGLILFGYLAYYYHSINNTTKAILFLILAILFQPLIKISLGRTVWNIVDVVVGIGLIIDTFLTEKNTK